MTKAELAEHIAHETGLTKTMAGRCMDAIGSITATKLAAGAEVTLPGIGKLVAVHKAERMGRNPRNGAAAKIPAKTAVKFKASATLKSAVN